MPTYAKETTVSAEKSIAEIQSTLKRFKADKYAVMDEGSRVVVGFEMKGRRVRFQLPLPPLSEFRLDGRRRVRTPMQMQNALEQAIRQRHRALLITIKAKLESVESGIETFDEAFMGQILLPTGQTMNEWATPQIGIAYQTGQMPALLASGQ